MGAGGEAQNCYWDCWSATGIGFGFVVVVIVVLAKVSKNQL
tara:strand:+ start:355 stop:477 length:123 start_codon:yes stop_codon:yes gene_type:complete